MLYSFQKCISVFLSCSNSLGKGSPHAVGLKSWYNSLIQWLDQRGGIWREKHHFDIGMKISNKRRMSGSIISNMQNLERYVYSSNSTSQFHWHSNSGGHPGRGAGSSMTSHCIGIALALCLMICLKALGFSLCHITKGFNS